MKQSGSAIALALILLAGCSKSPVQLVGEARRNQAAGQTNAALINLKAALAREPANAEAQELIGLIYRDAGALGDAERELRKAVAAGAPRERVLPVLAKVLLDLEQHQQLLLDLGLWSKEAPPETRVQLALMRAHVFLKTGDHQGAREQYEALIDKEPLGSEIGLVRVAAAANEMASARRMADRIVGSVPDNPEAWLVKGDVARGEGRYDEAREAYTRAVAVDGRFVPARLAIAQMALLSGDHASARKAVDEAQRLSPASPDVHYARALLALREQKYEECEASLRSVFRLIPRHMPSIQLSGALFLATGKLEAAQVALGTYLARYPGNLYARRQLAAVFIGLGQPQSAADVVEPLLKMGLGDADMLGLAGLAYLQLGEVAKARRYLEASVSADPSNVDSRTSLGLSRLAAGDRIGGTAALENAVAMSSQGTRAATFLVTNLLAQNQLDKALAAVEQMEHQRRADPEVLMLKGAVLLARADYDAARKTYEETLSAKPGHFPAAAALAQLDLRDKDPAGARRRIETVLQHDKRNLDAMLQMARFELLGRKRADAITWIRRAVGEHPQAFQPVLMLAQLQLQAGNIPEALNAARQARRLNPGDPSVLDVLGQAQVAAGQRSEAVGTFTALAALLPQSPLAQLQLASAYVAAGELRPAIAAAQRVLNIDRDNLAALSLLGALHVQMRQVPAALLVAERLKARHPSAAQGHAIEGDALMIKGDQAKAALAYERADRLQPSGMLRVRLHEARSLAGGALAEEGPLADWIQKHPKDVKVLAYLADVHVRQGRIAEAVERYLQAAQVEPQNVHILNELAWSLNKMGDARAVHYAEQAYRLRPDDPVVLDTLGWSMVTQGNLDDGLLHLVRAATVSNNRPEIRLHLAQAFLKRGNLDRARQELEALADPKVGAAVAAEARLLLTKTNAP